MLRKCGVQVAEALLIAPALQHSVSASSLRFCLRVFITKRLRSSLTNLTQSSQAAIGIAPLHCETAYRFTLLTFHHSPLRCWI